MEIKLEIIVIIISQYALISNYETRYKIVHPTLYDKPKKGLTIMIYIY